MVRLLRGWVMMLVVCLTAAPSTVLPAAAERRPNFLFIYTDDQRWDALGVVQREQGDRGRFPWLRTPNLDRLAASGVRFRNAFVVNALCSPSRATLLTGQYGHANGVVSNQSPHPPGNLSLPALLRPAGYCSAYIGKWHHGKESGKRPGFDFSVSFVGQGVYFDCPLEIDGVATPSQGFVDDVTTDYAARYIRDHRNEPFLLMLGFKTCHKPFLPPPRHAQTYDGERARRTPNLDVRPPFKAADPISTPRPAPSGDDATVPTNLGMFRGISAIDDNVGRLLDLLDELDLADDTVVCFSSDNGFYLGEHGLGDKRSAYDEAMRVPLLVRYPRMVTPGRIEDRIVLNVDAAPTFLDLAGVAVPPEMHGRSWRPLLEDRANAAWREHFFYCYFFERGFATPTTTALRTSDAKLIVYPGHRDWTELYDLKADPYETTNLADDPAHARIRESLEAAYQEQARAIGYHVPASVEEPPVDGPMRGSVKLPSGRKRRSKATAF